MKSYPSIPSIKVAGKYGESCTAFYKYDGSNLRFSFSPKKGWRKFGTRTRLFDRTDPDFGEAVDLFLNNFGTKLENIFKSEKLFRNSEEILAFCEFFGPNSFAGRHLASDKKELVLFDINIHKKGFISPREFYTIFEPQVKTAEVVYRGPLSKEFEAQVRTGTIPGLNEGVIAKGGSGHDLWMVKIKTDAYLQKLRERYEESWKDLGE